MPNVLSLIGPWIDVTTWKHDGHGLRMSLSQSPAGSSFNARQQSPLGQITRNLLPKRRHHQDEAFVFLA